MSAPGVTIKDLIKSPVSRVFRRASIKRRNISDAKFESSWLDISDEIISYGKVVNQVDSARRFKFTFGTLKLVVNNDEGLFSSSEEPSSLWYGYLNQQRTLVRIEAGFRNAYKDSNGIWRVNEFPSSAVWDEALWDEVDDEWDDDGSAIVFMGVLSGDVLLTDTNQVSLNIRPLVSVFQDFPAANLTGWTSTGVTASQFVTMLRDQVDSNGNYIFRPFFGDTTSNWEISTTSNVFANLNTATSKDIVDKTAWQIIESLAEAENFVPWITREGVFKFISRLAVESTTSFEFHGAGSFSSEYGQTIKAVNNYGFKISKYYSRVQIQWQVEDTTTSYVTREATLTVSAASNPWVFGVRTLSIQNFYIQTSTVADALALALFNDVSALKKEIQFTTTFIPHLDLFDRFSIHYDPTSFSLNNLWDRNNWAEDVTENTSDLVFDSQDGTGILLEGQEFKFLSFELDLDNFQNTFLAREI